ncbi:hypothetical protein [Haloprofundus halobius]|uniref:hypothetical protein n=1 Tax=Haloprofundus halobius TaxID=2876194 RepID=UPI001CCF9E6E|nr:hypothetical protein [Haloprofundus halobius]
MDARIPISEVRQEMNERADSSRGDFLTVLREQQQRVVTALETEETIDATPIIRDEEVLSCEEYVTLVYELHHAHLLELQTAGVIELNRHEETVTRGSRFHEARPVLKRGDDR